MIFKRQVKIEEGEEVEEAGKLVKPAKHEKPVKRGKL